MSDSSTKRKKHGLTGRLAVHLGMITKRQLVDVLRLQAESKKHQRFGELLVELNYIDETQLKKLLQAQRKYIQRQKEKQKEKKEALRRQEQAAENSNPESETGVFGGLLETNGDGHHKIVHDPLVECEVPEQPAEVSKQPEVDEKPPLRPESSLSLALSDTEPVPVVRFVPKGLDECLQVTLNKRGSDLHLQSGSAPFIRRFGRIVRLKKKPVSTQKMEKLLREFLTSQQFDSLEQNGDLDFAWQMSGGARLRTNCFSGTRGPGVVFHLVRAAIPALDELNVPSVVARLATYHQGLVLVAGPAGCGKSSTVAALVGLINDERRENVLILEDPIEFVHEPLLANIIQREIPRDSKSFSSALRAALREDPDVIVIGEMRDLETISLAITAAETGHLVLATVHTADCAGTIDRLIGSFPAEQHGQIRSMLSESIRAVVAQRLLERADRTGCVPAMEIMFNNPAIAKLIRSGQTFQIPNAIKMGVAMGMRLMNDAIDELERNGVISKEEANRGRA